MSSLMWVLGTNLGPLEELQVQLREPSVKALPSFSSKVIGESKNVVNFNYMRTYLHFIISDPLISQQ